MQSAKKPSPITKIIKLATHIHMLKSTGKPTSTLKHVNTCVVNIHNQSKFMICRLYGRYNIYTHKCTTTSKLTVTYMYMHMCTH